jgi:hypothetical protein
MRNFAATASLVLQRAGAIRDTLLVKRIRNGAERLRRSGLGGGMEPQEHGGT